MTITSMTTNYMSSYSFTSNYDSSDLDAIEESYSQEYYGLTSITNAMDAVSNTDEDQYMSIGSAYDYAKSQLSLSQLSDYSSLTEDEESYEISGISSVSSYASQSSQYDALIEAYTSEDSYTSYLGDQSSIFDTLL